MYCARIGQMVLYINTKDQKVVSVSLKKEDRVLKSLSLANKLGSQVLLPLIEKILKSQKLTFQDLDEIKVNTGPGSFTGIRVGVSIANTLGFALNIPVNEKKIEAEIKYK